jgi:hypothetical protein
LHLSSDLKKKFACLHAKWGLTAGRKRRAFLQPDKGAPNSSFRRAAAPQEGDKSSASKAALYGKAANKR